MLLNPEDVNQTKYGQIKAAIFIIDQWNHGLKKWYRNDLMHNEGKSVVAERWISTLKNSIYKYMTSISKTYILIN